jgi:hypothetical protein
MALVDVTEEQAAARVRAVQARTALGQAAELVEHIRALMVPSDGRTEPGVAVAVERTPLHTERADDADDLYVRLLEWVQFWSETLGSMPPSVAVVGWSRVDEDSPVKAPARQFLGFRAGTTPAGAGTLIRLLTMWLLSRDERLEQHESAGAFQADVTSLVWGLRAKYRLSAVHVRSVRPRLCSTCGELAVEAWWRSADPLDVVVECLHCGQQFEVGTPSQILAWITAGDQFEAACAACGWVTGGGFTSRSDALDALGVHMRGEH